jgi:hypothetical protein
MALRPPWLLRPLRAHSKPTSDALLLANLPRLRPVARPCFKTPHQQSIAAFNLVPLCRALRFRRYVGYLALFGGSGCS